MTRIEGRDVFGDDWAASDHDDGDSGAAAWVYHDEEALALDAPSALRLGAFLLARGLGVSECQVASGTLVLVAPEGICADDVDNIARRLRDEPPPCRAIVLPAGWTALDEREASARLAALIAATKEALIEFRDALPYVPDYFRGKYGYDVSADRLDVAIRQAEQGQRDEPSAAFLKGLRDLEAHEHANISKTHKEE